MSAVSVVAVLHPVPEKVDEAVAAVLRAVAGIQAEEGCEQYAPHLGDDGTIIILERWSSREALAAHNVGAPVQVLRDGVKGLMASPPDVTIAVAL
jgi:quinol monooxygenase YgiN